MSKRHPNPRLARIHRSYTVEEVASVFGVHRNTVREWVKRGLPTSDDRRPMLILGADLFAFLRARRAKNKHTCQLDESAKPSMNSDFRQGVTDHDNAQP